MGRKQAPPTTPLTMTGAHRLNGALLACLMASTAAQTCVKPSTLASPLNFCTNVSYAVYVPPNVSIEDLDHKAQTAYLASMGNFAQGCCSAALRNWVCSQNLLRCRDATKPGDGSMPVCLGYLNNAYHRVNVVRHDKCFSWLDEKTGADNVVSTSDGYSTMKATDTCSCPNGAADATTNAQCLPATGGDTGCIIPASSGVGTVLVNSMLAVASSLAVVMVSTAL